MSQPGPLVFWLADGEQNAFQSVGVAPEFGAMINPMAMRTWRGRETVWGRGLLAAYGFLIAFAVIGYLLDWAVR